MDRVVISVRLFAVLREAAGRDRLEVQLADGASVADLLAALGKEPGLEDSLARMPVVTAVNREYVREGHRLSEGDEVALIPPVSGGDRDSAPDRTAGGQTRTADGETRTAHAQTRTADGETRTADIHARVTPDPLDLAVLARRVGRSGAGAVVTFSGTTREVERLDYEAYAEMAQTAMAAILADCVERHGLEAAAAEHRVGPVPLGETSVIVAVSAAHRAEAFAGAREAIDRIKAEAPIWKREVHADGAERWVAGAPPSPPAT